MVTRRSFVQSTIAGLFGTAILPDDRPAPAEEKADSRPPIVDCHTHFYDPTRPEGIPWPGKDDDVLYRPVLPKHFLKEAEPVGVTKTIVIEASPRVEDNACLLELARANSSVLGVVGNLAPGQPMFREHLRKFAANKLFRGIRVGQESIRLALEKPEALADLRQLVEHDLELDAIGPPETASDVARLAETLPDLRIVINHVCGVTIDGKPPPSGMADGHAQRREVQEHFLQNLGTGFTGEASDRGETRTAGCGILQADSRCNVGDLRRRPSDLWQ